MKKYCKIVVVLLVLITVVGCGKKTENVIDEINGKDEVNVKEEQEHKDFCLKLVKEAKEEFEKNNVGPFSQALCTTSKTITNIYFKDYDEHVYNIDAYNEKLSSYSTNTSSLLYDSGSCDNEDNLSSYDKIVCGTSRLTKSNYEINLKLAEIGNKGNTGYYYFKFEESEFK